MLLKSHKFFDRWVTEQCEVVWKFKLVKCQIMFNGITQYLLFLIIFMMPVPYLSALMAYLSPVNTCCHLSLQTTHSWLRGSASYGVTDVCRAKHANFDCVHHGHAGNGAPRTGRARKNTRIVIGRKMILRSTIHLISYFTTFSLINPRQALL